MALDDPSREAAHAFGGRERADGGVRRGLCRGRRDRPLWLAPVGPGLLTAVGLLCTVLAPVAARGATLRFDGQAIAQGRSPNAETELRTHLRLALQGRRGFTLDVDVADSTNWLLEAHFDWRTDGGRTWSLGRIPLPYRYLAPAPILLETTAYPRVPLPLYGYGVVTSSSRGALQLDLGACGTSQRPLDDPATYASLSLFQPDLSVPIADVREDVNDVELFARAKWSMPHGVNFAALAHYSSALRRVVCDGEWRPRPELTLRGAMFAGVDEVQGRMLESQGAYALLAGAPWSRAPGLQLLAQVEHYTQDASPRRRVATVGIRYADAESRRSLTLDVALDERGHDSDMHVWLGFVMRWEHSWTLRGSH